MSLQAKREAYQVHSQLLLGGAKSPDPAHREKSKKRKKKVTGKTIQLEGK